MDRVIQLNFNNSISASDIYPHCHQLSRQLTRYVRAPRYLPFPPTKESLERFEMLEGMVLSNCFPSPAYLG